MPSLQVNERAILARDIRLGGMVIAAGTKGVVVDIDPEEGVLFRLDRPHASLTTWRNMLPVDDTALSPYRSLAQRVGRFTHPVLIAGLIMMGVGIFTTHTDESATAHNDSSLLSPVPLLPNSGSPAAANDCPLKALPLQAMPLPAAPSRIGLENPNATFGV